MKATTRLKRIGYTLAVEDDALEIWQYALHQVVFSKKAKGVYLFNGSSKLYKTDELSAILQRCKELKFEREENENII